MSDHPTHMHAMVLTKGRAIELQSRATPTLGTGEVLLDVDLCGICGSDLHAAELTQVYTGEHILGHEAVGRIRAIGSDVVGWAVGQRVSVNPNGNTCGVCEYCRAGRLNFCVQATLERAVGLLDGIGVRVLGSDQVRDKLSLRARV